MKTILFLNFMSFILFFPSTMVNANPGGDLNKLIPHEEKASFPGGPNSLAQYFQANLIYPEYARENGYEGKIVVGFVVNKNGRITKVRILEGVETSLNQEAIRLIQAMPNWNPGKNNDRPVKTHVSLPIRFALE